MIFELGVPSTPQVVGYTFLTFSAAAQMACAPAVQQWWLQFHLFDFEETLCIMPNHRACAATDPWDRGGVSLSFGGFFPQYAVLLRILHVFLLYYGTSNTLHNTPKIRKEYVRNTCTCILHSDT